jgi:hypothetical protein
MPFIGGPCLHCVGKTGEREGDPTWRLVGHRLAGSTAGTWRKCVGVRHGANARASRHARAACCLEWRSIGRRGPRGGLDVETGFCHVAVRIGALWCAGASAMSRRSNFI